MESLRELIVVMKCADYPEKKNNLSVCTEGAKETRFHETSDNQMPRLIPVLNYRESISTGFFFPLMGGAPLDRMFPLLSILIRYPYSSPVPYCTSYPKSQRIA